KSVQAMLLLNGFALLLLLLALQPAHCMMYSEGVNHTEMTKNVTETLNRLLDDYDRNLRPDFGRGPIKIRINMNIRSMGPISERSMIYSFDCYFRQEWTDTRLTFPAHDNFTHLQLNEKMLREIWKPDTYIVNGMGSYLHNITSPNVLFRIKNTGEILYSMRLTIKATCPMDLLKFPMDNQTCPLEISSHGYTDDDVIFEWSLGDQSIQLNRDLLLSQFDLKKTFIKKADRRIGRRGRFSVLLCDFELHRHMGYFLIQLYLPCSLLVVLSWVGFWINREATSDRIRAEHNHGLLTMTFLGRWTTGRTCQGSRRCTTSPRVSSGECHLTLVEITGRACDDSGDDDGDGDATATARADGGGGGGPVRYRTGRGRPQPQAAAVTTGGTQEQQAPADAGNGQQVRQADGECSSRFRDSCAYAFLNCLRGSSRYKQMKLASPIAKADQLTRSRAAGHPCSNPPFSCCGFSAKLGASGGCSEEAEETAHSASPWRPTTSVEVVSLRGTRRSRLQRGPPHRRWGKKSARPVSLRYRASSGMLSGLQTLERTGFGP
uniref:Neur_chan_LBD domain-containing protein n=1 Tax=Macrostomum lignano TaxID=282301 RepID=A0A1I8F3M5_9PLAT